MASPQYSIQTSLRGHDKAVRTLSINEKGHVLTGGNDGLAKIWVQCDGEDAEAYSELKTLYEHGHWISSSLPIGEAQARVIGDAYNGGFVTGCMDGMIRVYDGAYNLGLTLVGHDKGVISLSWAQNGDLISGSWDETAKVWNTPTAECKQSLSGHENGVCVLGLANGDVVTGSTGRQENNTIVDFQIRIWRNGTLLKQNADHSGPIRALCEIPGVGFASCSNDGTVKVRTVDGSTISTLAANASGSSGFLLCVAYIGSNMIAAAGVDGVLVVWNLDGSELHRIQHPGCVWCLNSENGDILSGCEDAVARRFTADPTKRGTEVTIVQFEQEVKESAVKSAPQAVDVAGLPSYSDRFTIQGAKAGEVKMFNKDGVAWACHWEQAARTWIDIGQVTGVGGGGGTVDGRSYDMVIPVEIEDPASGSVRKLEIGYNQTDNPFQVAQDFIDKHMLRQDYLQQIAEHIIKMSEQHQPRVIGDVSAASTSTQEPQQKAYKHIPQRVCLTFEKVNLEAIFDKISEFNESQMNIEPGSALSEKELSDLQSMKGTLQETSRYHSSRFPPKTGLIVTKLISWPLDKVFPGLDMLRVMVTHPHGNDLLITEVDIINKILRILEQDAVPMAAAMLSLRVLVNACVRAAGKAAIADNGSQIVATCCKYAHHENKSVRQSQATLLLNIAVCQTLMSRNDEVGKNVNKQIIDCVVKALKSTVTRSEEELVRLLLALGTTILKEPAQREEALETVQNLNTEQSSTTLLQEIVADIASIE